LGLDINLEDLPVHGRVNDPGRGQAMAPQTSNEGLCFPCPKRRVSPVSLAFRCPSGPLGQLGVGGSLVDEHQP